MCSACQGLSLFQQKGITCLRQSLTILVHIKAVRFLLYVLFWLPFLGIEIPIKPHACSFLLAPIDGRNTPLIA